MNWESVKKKGSSNQRTETSNRCLNIQTIKPTSARSRAEGNIHQSHGLCAPNDCIINGGTLGVGEEQGLMRLTSSHILHTCPQTGHNDPAKAHEQQQQEALFVCLFVCFRAVVRWFFCFGW